MRANCLFHIFLLALCLGLFIGQAHAKELRIATASNFLGTIKELTARYKERTGHEVTISSGSSGALYAQIVNGAPHDLFFSADTRRAKALVDDGLAYKQSRFTYAVGVPVLWSNRKGWLEDPRAELKGVDYRFLTIAEPRNAPYGVAAQRILQALDIWNRLNEEGKLLRARNVTQAHAQIASGAADLGFIALSQVQDSAGNVPGSYWLPPAQLFNPIEQQAVILKSAHDLKTAREFMTWMQGKEATQIIEAAGYATP